MEGHFREAQPGVHALFRRIAHGAEGGIVAGLAFLLADMAVATARGQPAVAPLYVIATVFTFSARPALTAQALSTGLVTHACLAMLFGVMFALLLPLLPRLHSLTGGGELRTLALGGTLYGLMLYLFNYQVLARLFFPSFVDPADPIQPVAAGLHVLYGLLVGVFFVGLLPGSSRARHTAPS